VGIVASRLTEKYYRPAVVLTKSGEMISGSARSVPGFDVYKAIESCRDILENFGGHTYAAGLTLRGENLQEFTERFNMLSFDGVEARMMLPQITVDVEIPLSQISPFLIAGLDLFNPFGPENENPIFLSREVVDAGGSRLVGQEGRHIKMEIVDKTTDRPFPGIAFSRHDFYPHIKAGLPVDICYTIEENRHGGNSFTQLIIKDIKE
jgi:single-stranded-DNA-specific exonuclease